MTIENILYSHLSVNALEIQPNLKRGQQLWCLNQDLLCMSSKMEEQALLSPTPYKKEGLVKLILKTSKTSSLAFRANVVIDPCLYLLYPTDLGLVLSEVQAELNYIIEEAAVARDLSEVVNQVPDAVLNPLVEFLTKELPHGPSQERWEAVIQGSEPRFCPTLACKACGWVRYVAPSHYLRVMVSPLCCTEVGLLCNSPKQKAPVLRQNQA